VSDDSCTCAVLSSFISEKSGAELPACNVPARACVQSVSKGRIRKGIGPGIFAITRAKRSGGRRITLYSATQAITHSVAITQNVATVALTYLDFALTRFCDLEKKCADYR